MARQGFDLQLTRYDARGWRATFYTTAMEHSATSATASAWESTPWHATQRAAWDALNKAQRGWLDLVPRRASRQRRPSAVCCRWSFESGTDSATRPESGRSSDTPTRPTWGRPLTPA